MLGDLFATMKPFAAPPPPGAQPPPLWGSEQHLAELFGDRVEFHTLKRDVLEITAFPRARDYGEHFKAYYGPTIAVRANAEKDGRAEKFDQALDAFCDRWNLGTADQGRFEKEFLLAVGTRRLSTRGGRAHPPRCSIRRCSLDRRQEAASRRSSDLWRQLGAWPFKP
jgi:hypothetical protein